MSELTTVKAKCGVGLGPILPEHSPLLFKWRNTIPELYLWNGERNFIDPESFKKELQALADRVLDAAIISARDGTPAGFVYAEQKGPYRTGTSIGLYVASEYRRREIGAVGFALFADHLFFNHNLGKIKVAVAGWNSASMAIVNRFPGILRFEGTQQAELLLDGQTWDLHNYAIFREDFETQIRGSALWRRLIGPDERKENDVPRKRYARI